MKIYCRNHIALNDICVMLNDIYGNDHRFDNYIVAVDFIGLNKELIEYWKNLGYYTVRYDLDHIKCCRNELKEADDNVDEIWTYSLENKEFYKSLGYNVKFRPIVYTEKLISKNITLLNNPPIDAFFYGNLSERRYKLFTKIQNEKNGKFSFYYAHALPKNVLDWTITNSKIILNCKQNDEMYNQEICRIFYPLINNKCVLSEMSNCDEYASDNIAYFTYNNVTQKILELLKCDNYKKYENNGIKYKTLCESGDIYHTSEV